MKDDVFFRFTVNLFTLVKVKKIIATLFQRVESSAKRIHLSESAEYTISFVNEGKEVAVYETLGHSTYLGKISFESSVNSIFSL